MSIFRGGCFLTGAIRINNAALSNPIKHIYEGGKYGDRVDKTFSRPLSVACRFARVFGNKRLSFGGADATK